MPVTSNLRTGYILSIIAISIAVLVSLAGLMAPISIYGTGEKGAAFWSVDLVVLAFAVPLALLALFFANREQLPGLACWIGMLFYLAYNYIPYVFDLAVGPLLIPWLFLIASSLSAGVFVLTAIDMERFRSQYDQKVPARVSGGILLGLGVFIILYQAGEIAQILLEGTNQTSSSPALMFADIVLAAPLLIFSGWALWNREGIGYLLGAAMLFGYAILSLGLILSLILQTTLKHIPLDIDAIVAVSLMVILCAIPLGYFIKAR